MDKLAKFSQSFAVFSPTGHIVMVFATDGDAEKARKDLVASGFSEDDVTRYNSDEVLSELEKSQEQSVNPLQIGQDVAKIPEYLRLRKKAAGITRKIRAAIIKDKSSSTYAHNVKIITQDGKVTLKGPVRTEKEKTDVEAKASAIVGSENVTNEIAVAPAKP